VDKPHQQRQKESIMAISSISGVSGNFQVPGATEAAVVQTGSKSNDGDSDDTSVQPVNNPPPLPTVNSSGQKIGQILNVAA
jgi:hypothetical protein